VGLAKVLFTLTHTLYIYIYTVDPRKSNGLILEQLENRTKNSRKILFETEIKIQKSNHERGIAQHRAAHDINSKVEQIESQTASWNGLCSTFEGPLYIYVYILCMYNRTLYAYIMYVHVCTCTESFCTHCVCGLATGLQTFFYPSVLERYGRVEFYIFLTVHHDMILDK
jgi:hypothetical protein